MPSSEKPVNWDNLAKSIANGEAVLVLGPDAIPFHRAQSFDNGANGQPYSSFSELSRKAILAANDIGIAYYYPRDNLFLFKDKVDKRNAQKLVRECAQDRLWIPDQELLQQIAAIPFCLMININPDEHIYESLIHFRVDAQFDYFTIKDKTQPSALKTPVILDKPTNNNPILYNLCGDVCEKLDSQILDYNDLFELFQQMLSNGIPDSIRLKLKEADRFVFLGLHIEKWYFQLLIHYLNQLDHDYFNHPTRNFSILSDLSEDNKEFILKQFNLEFITPSQAAFGELFKACERQGILRKLDSPLSSISTRLMVNIKQDNFDRVFKLLEEYGNINYLKETLQLQARYADWKKKEQQKTVEQQLLNVEINKIREALITLAIQISDEKKA